MVQITGGVLGTKAVSLGDLDEFLDYLVSGGDGTEPQDLYAAVAWTFWCVNLRANNIAQVPYLIYPETLDKADETEDNAVEWDIDLTPTLWDVEAWLCLKAAAYVLKRANQVKIKDLQVLNANTMRVLEYDADGPTVFRQQVGSKWKDYPAEEIVYFRTFNPKDDINAGVGSGQVGQTTGSLIKNANEWASKFFENGAIPAVMLTTEGAVPPGEKQRIESVWEKMLKGVQKAFKTVVLERGLKPTVVGQPIKDLAMPDLERTKREQILAAHLVPPGLAEAKTNRAERDSLQYELWTQALVPELTVHLAPALDRQLFNPLGLRISFQTHKVEAIQREEIAKAESAAFYIGGVANVAYEANVISVDEYRRVVDQVLVMGSMPKLDETFTPEERAPAVPFGGGDDNAPGTPEIPSGETTENRTNPKALPPAWGRLPTVSLPSLVGGETRQSSEADPLTLTAQ
jgi:HK97 family phage portal protein